MGLLNDLTSFSVSVARLGRGLYPIANVVARPEPKQRLQLYDFEACPYCRRVREVLCELDLDYLCYPVAKGGHHRNRLKKLGGKVQAPFLVDPNTKTQLYESDAIITYLNQTYGAGKAAGWRLPVPSLVDNLASAAASALRYGYGTVCRVRRHGKEPLPLTMYNMEGSPYCRKVRETLCELDLVHVVKNVPKGSPRRAHLQALGGKMQVPYLIDPNTGHGMYESDDIVTYLEEQYA